MHVTKIICIKDSSWLGDDEFAKETIFFSYSQTAQKWKFTVPSWLGDDKARHRGVHVGPGMKLSRIRKFEDENGHFHSLGTELSFRR